MEPKPKPGVASSEFWVMVATWVSQALPFVREHVALPPWVAGAALVAYIVSRGLTKGGVPAVKGFPTMGGNLARFLVLGVLGTGVLVGCGSDMSPTAPTPNGPTQMQQTVIVQGAPAVPAASPAPSAVPAAPAAWKPAFDTSAQ